MWLANIEFIICYKFNITRDVEVYYSPLIQTKKLWTLYEGGRYFQKLYVLMLLVQRAFLIYRIEYFDIFLYGVSKLHITRAKWLRALSVSKNVQLPGYHSARSKHSTVKFVFSFLFYLKGWQKEQVFENKTLTFIEIVDIMKNKCTEVWNI